jgi:hypothetical protein
LGPKRRKLLGRFFSSALVIFFIAVFCSTVGTIDVAEGCRRWKVSVFFAEILDVEGKIRFNATPKEHR